MPGLQRYLRHLRVRGAIKIDALPKELRKSILRPIGRKQAVLRPHAATL